MKDFVKHLFITIAVTTVTFLIMSLIFVAITDIDLVISLIKSVVLSFSI